MTAVRVLSIQAGLPRPMGAEGTAEPPWTSGIVKEPVAGPVRVGRPGLDGDGQADRRFHGGPDKAVLAYSADHYPLWRTELERPDLPFGAFGENLTVAGLTEDDVCIGDLWAIGAIRLQISQPRQPCWKLARRWQTRDLTKRVVQTGRTGWYLRVLTEGVITPDDPLTLLARPHPAWPIPRVAHVRRHRHDDPAAAAELAALPELSQSWRDELPSLAPHDAG